MTASSLVTHTVFVGPRRTSVRLEPAMWAALNDVARRRRVTRNDLVAEIDRTRTASGLTSAIRVYVVEFYRGVADARREAA